LRARPIAVLSLCLLPVSASRAAEIDPYAVACDRARLAAEAAAMDPAPSERISAPGDRCVASCVTPVHIHRFEDSAGILVDPSSTNADEVALEVEAANELIASYGDRFDFIGFWTNFDPTTRLFGANFRHVFNDTSGTGLSFIDQRAALGLNSAKLQGFITMYDLHRTANWNLSVTLDHEFGHRWMVYMAPLLDGRPMSNGSHTQCALDVQGGMHGVEWSGDHKPHQRSADNNVDTGVVWGWLQLYLMGHAGAAEVQAGMSERRYMNNAVATCPTTYDGVVSGWTVQDIIDVNGPRVPAVSAAQKSFRVGWIMIHQPGDPPTAAELDDIASLLDGYCGHWNANTLGRGEMTQTLFDDCDCSGVPGSGCPECFDATDCDDGSFCNGAEACSAGGLCAAGAPPCSAGQICDETGDVCLSCNDADGDGFGAPGSAQCPAGPLEDCDPADAAVHPGAPEVNDGKDNQCPGDAGRGLVDELADDLAFSDPVDRDRFCWGAQPGAVAYHVIRSSSAGFAGPCIGGTTANPCWTDVEDPGPQQVFHYLRRASLPHPGSWGLASTGERLGLCP